MAENLPHSTIPIIVGPLPPEDHAREPRRDSSRFKIAKSVVDVDIDQLQGQVHIFLQQLDQVMQETPEMVGGFRLAEFEVSVGIVVEAKGEVRIALLANMEAGGGINAGFKLTFKRF